MGKPRPEETFDPLKKFDPLANPETMKSALDVAIKFNERSLKFTGTKDDKKNLRKWRLQLIGLMLHDDPKLAELVRKYMGW